MVTLCKCFYKRRSKPERLLDFVLDSAFERVARRPKNKRGGILNLITVTQRFANALARRRGANISTRPVLAEVKGNRLAVGRLGNFGINRVADIVADGTRND
jgi:hypothetical protein